VEGEYSEKEILDMARTRARWERGQLPLRGKKVFDMNSGRPLDAGEHEQGRTTGAEEVGNRETTTVSLGGDWDFRAFQEAQERLRGRSDDWLE